MTRWQAFDARLGRPGPFHVRTDLPDGSKRVAWRVPSGAWGLGEHRIEDLVYLQRLPMPSPVVITEGEKAADAVRAAGLAAVATVCGAGTAPGIHVVELFTGCRVILWPDADANGRDHMAMVARRLEPIVATLALVDVPADAPKGWDAADATPATIRRLVATAHDVYLFRPRSAWLQPVVGELPSVRDTAP